MADDTRWMTYADLAEALGIGADSARNLVRRKRWARKAGNDGLARVSVPLDHLAQHSTPDAPADEATDPPASPPADGPLDAPVNSYIRGEAIPALERHIERLERDLAAASAERDAERARAVQVDVLRAVLEAEQRRSTELREERDRWQTAATAPRGFLGWLRRA